MIAKKLTVKQQRFVDFYDGNGTEAARKAGYKGDRNQLHTIAAQNLQKLTIKQAIEKREEKRNKKDILSREERQKFWSDVTQDGDVQMRDRLRASELLGKSNADFIERVDVNLGNCGAVRDIENGEEDNLVHLPKKKAVGSTIGHGLDEKEDNVE